MNASNSVPRLLRLREVRSMTGLSQSTLYALMQTGDFPRPVRLTTRTVAWPENLVADWIAARLRSANAA